MVVIKTIGHVAIGDEFTFQTNKEFYKGALVAISTQKPANNKYGLAEVEEFVGTNDKGLRIYLAERVK